MIDKRGRESNNGSRTMKNILSKMCGFTLIELMVVVSIIAILSGVAVSTYSNAQKKTRDAKVMAEIDSVAKAYEASYDPTKGGYLALKPQDFNNDAVPGVGRFTGFISTTPQPWFRICTTLESGESYCRTSSQAPAPTISPTPTITPTPTSTSTPTPTGDPSNFGLTINSGAISLPINITVSPGQSISNAFTISSNYNIITNWRIVPPDLSIGNVDVILIPDGGSISPGQIIPIMVRVAPQPTPTTYIRTLDSTPPAGPMVLINMTNNKTQAFASTVTVSSSCAIPIGSYWTCSISGSGLTDGYVDCITLSSDQKNLLQSCGIPSCSRMPFNNIYDGGGNSFGNVDIGTDSSCYGWSPIRIHRRS